MTLNLGILPKMLFKPREAFTQVQATATDGIILVVLFAIIVQAITFALGTFKGSAVVNVVGNVVAFIIIAWLVSVIAKRFDKGTGDFGATLGLMGYTSFLGVIFLIIITLISFAGISVGVTASSLGGNPTALASAGIIGAVIGIAYFMWSLWLVENAISVANNISTWKALGTYIVSAAIIGFIEGIVISAIHLV